MSIGCFTDVIKLRSI